MHAAVLTDDHRFVVESLPDPTPGASDLVLRVEACGICGSDLKAHDHMPGGIVMGHEFCGEVVAVGADASDRWREGDLVAAMPLNACGRCRWCLADDAAHCEVFDPLGVGGSAGAFADFVKVAASSAVGLSEGLRETGALVEPLAVGLHTVVAGRIGPGDRVLVIGGGNVGAAVSTWARRFGAAEVVVSDPSPTRRDSASLFGATGVHDPSAGAAPTGYDVVVECVGLPGLVQTAIDAAAVRGRVVVAGVCTSPDQFQPLGAVLKEITMSFAVYYRMSEFVAAAALLESGGVDTEAFVTDRVALDGVDGAFRSLLGGSSDRKVLVTPNRKAD
jgi:(R,R)-butanediol dehydrogenase/meso-butanediol dehydrogenase/diacetyl reductase